jgi:hypothetical protein
VPNDFKSARVVPNYKKKSRTEAGNYRPVSILSCLSKIIERAVYVQLEQYCKSKDLIYKFQSGFRSSYSTDTALTHLMDSIKINSDQGNYTGMVLLDLQKAFDTVNHDILCNKLKAIGIDNNSVSWFRSYLSNRQQVINVNNHVSDPLDITCGVPQGSILGPLLFLIYVNDMQAAVSCQLLLYADDSSLMVSSKCVHDIQNKLSQEMASLSEWLCDNKLSLHLGKTESILFGSKRKLKRVPFLKINCKDVPIESNNSVGYLGADIDQNCSGEFIANKIIKKANSRLKFLYRKSKYFDLYLRKTLCQALILCHFDYACSAWYSGLMANLKHKLQVCQNKAIRFV